MLCSPTCVGLRYGHLRLARGFSRQPEYLFFGYLSFPSPSPPSLVDARICLCISLTAWTSIHQLASLSFCVTPLLVTAYGGTGISTCCPSTTPFGLALGPDLPWADEPSPGTLRLSADKILTCLFVTHTGILTCMQSTVPSGTTSTRIQRSPTARIVSTPASKKCFSPWSIWPDSLTQPFVVESGECSAAAHSLKDAVETMLTHSFGGVFSPVTFSAQSHSTSELLRTL